MERHHFETELAALRNQLLTMGGLVEERVHRAIQSLIHRKEEEARRIIATVKIEELMYSLKEHYTIVIVTHNLQQAARVSDKTAFMYLGELIEFDDTSKIFTSPRDRRTQDYITGRFG